jgi:diaminohydroxyphosphoribosylaminopyrimidine deaminase/5-amino-6-(5-phosphoribosylamino)uracil reductase
VEVVRVGSRDGRVDPRRAVLDLGRREVASVLVEGGGEVHASMLAAGLVDKVRLYVAPALLGGRGAVPVVGGRGAARPSGGVRLARWTARRLGPDLLVEGYPAR